MIFTDRKKAASVILEKLRPDGGAASAEAKSEDNYDPAKEILRNKAEDLLLAIKNDSVNELVAALQALGLGQEEED